MSLPPPTYGPVAFCSICQYHLTNTGVCAECAAAHYREDPDMEPLCPICRKVFTEGQATVVPTYHDPAYPNPSQGEKYHKDCFQGLYVRWVDGGEQPAPPDYVEMEQEHLDLERRKTVALETIAEAMQYPTINVGNVSYHGPADGLPDPIEIEVAKHVLGFTQTVDPEADEAVNGFTCTACGAFVELPPEGGFSAEDLVFLEQFHQDDVRAMVIR